MPSAPTQAPEFNNWSVTNTQEEERDVTVVWQVMRASLLREQNIHLGILVYLFFTRREVKMVKINPLHSKISMQTLHTTLYTFPKVLTRRICLTIKSFLSW